MFNKAQLVLAFRQLGIVKGSLLFVHSALSSIGPVEGGAQTVIEAFLEVLGPEGTLCMPAFYEDFLQPFDPEKTPSNAGYLSEAFRQYPNVKRSLHPTHSVCALGSKADMLTEGHENSETACGPDTPFGKLVAEGGYVLLLGVDMNRNTLLHSAEEAVNASYLQESLEMALPTYLKDQAEGQDKFYLKKAPMGHRDFLKITPVLRKEGLLLESRVGQAQCKLMPAAQTFETAKKLLKQDINFFLCENEYCNFCRGARNKTLPDKKKQKVHEENRCIAEFCEVCRM